MAEEVTRDEGGQQVTVIRPEAEAAQKQEFEANRKARMDEFMKRFTARFTFAKESEMLQRSRSLEEEEFNSGKHWDPELYKERTGKDRVCLEINRTPQYLNQVANEERMTTPNILVRPVGYGADGPTATIKQGMVRSIERRSGAKGIRDDAFYGMLEKGWACYRVNEEWESERSHRRVIRTASIDNDFSVYCDPAARAVDKSDANWMIITDDAPIEDYKEQHPDSSLTSLDPVSIGDNMKDWYSGGMVRTAEYFYKVREYGDLYALPSTDPENPYNYLGKFKDEMGGADWVVAVRDDRGEFVKRKSFRERVYWAKVNAVEVIEGNEDLTGGRMVQGRYIPVLYLTGRRILVNGQHIYTGMVRDAMAPCLASDYWLSAITEMVALAPKAPWVAASKAIDNYKEIWTTANIENYSVLPWDHVDESGKPIPKPERSFGEPPIQAMTFILRFADEDLKRVMGIYSAGLGAPGPETSGLAIQSRQKESDVANYNFLDNMKRTIAQEARIYLDMIPKVYDQAQAMEITRADGSVEPVLINTIFKNKTSGKDVIYDMGTGDYDIDVEVGASFDTKRLEAANQMVEYLRIDPQAAPYVGDLIARQQNYADKEEFEKRLKARVPPEALNDEEVDGSKIPPKFKAQYDQQAQMVEQLTEAVQKLQEEADKETRKFEHEEKMKAMELSSQELIASEKNRTQLIISAEKKADAGE